jgi:hypothetical protein
VAGQSLSNCCRVRSGGRPANQVLGRFRARALLRTDVMGLAMRCQSRSTACCIVSTTR